MSVFIDLSSFVRYLTKEIWQMLLW